MSLNAKYMIAPSLQEYFVDKQTGLPLSNGQVYFFSDVNRTVLKTAYTIDGVPPNYGYVALPNPCPLSGVGTFTDGANNDVLPYYYPFDANGNIELYYIQVFDANGVLQFTREGWPNFAGETNSQSSIDFVNYIPNGQFLLHNSNQPLNTTEFGSTSIDYTSIAQGGWYFARTHGSTANDVISFPVNQNYISNPSASPRFEVELKRTIASADNVCDLRVRFTDVNKFASLTQQYFLQFSAISLTGSQLSDLNLNIYKYFGTGTNSPTGPATINVDTFNVNASTTNITALVNFGNNTGNTIGNNNDDFLEICIDLNTGINTIFDIKFTDFILTPFTDQTAVEFPTTPDSEFSYQSMTLPIPNPDGSSLFLPIKSGTEGLIYDFSEIGKIQYTLSQTANSSTNELLCNGAQYKRSDYSDLGIPYSRLHDYLLGISPYGGQGIPLYGTGTNYLTTYLPVGPATQDIIRVITNKPYEVTKTADGSSPTNFTFWNSTNVTSGKTGGNFGFNSYSISSNEIVCEATYLTSSFVTPIDHTSGALTLTLTNNQGNINFCRFTLTVNSAPAAGTYFTFSSNTTNYYMWFKVDNVGTDPAVAATTGIMVNLSSQYNSTDIVNAIREALSGYGQTIITCTAGAVITTGSFFSVYVADESNNENQYVIWYNINSGGNKPSVVGATLIEIDILSTDTNARVAAVTQAVINRLYYAVPDFRGMFFRNWDNGRGIDYGANERPGANLSYLFGDTIGTFEYNEIQNHTHSTVVIGPSPGIEGGGGESLVGGSTGASGGPETRPINAYVNAVIKY